MFRTQAAEPPPFWGESPLVFPATMMGIGSHIAVTYRWGCFAVPLQQRCWGSFGVIEGGKRGSISTKQRAHMSDQLTTLVGRRRARASARQSLPAHSISRCARLDSLPLVTGTAGHLSWILQPDQAIRSSRSSAFDQAISRMSPTLKVDPNSRFARAQAGARELPISNRNHAVLSAYGVARGTCTIAR